MSCKGPARRTMRDDVCYALPCSSEIGGDEGNKIKPQTRQILHCCVVPLNWLLYNDDDGHNNDRPPKDPVQCCARKKNRAGGVYSIDEYREEKKDIEVESGKQTLAVAKYKRGDKRKFDRAHIMY